MNTYLFGFALLMTIFSVSVNDYRTNWLGIARAGVIKGQVMSVIDDRPIAGAIVTVLKNGRTKATAVTDSGGFFTIPGLPASSYNVIAENKKYGSLTIESVPVSKGNEVITHFILTPTYSIQ